MSPFSYFILMSVLAKAPFDPNMLCGNTHYRTYNSELDKCKQNADEIMKVYVKNCTTLYYELAIIPCWAADTYYTNIFNELFEGGQK